MYGEVSIIVEGALDETVTIGSEHGLSRLVDRVQVEANDDDFTAEIYVVWHSHKGDVEECACVQYLTDHKPYAVVKPQKG